MQTREQRWNFPDLEKHQPDCSQVTTQEILDLIYTRWAMKNGCATIAYTFNSMPYFLQPFKDAVSRFYVEKIFKVSDPDIHPMVSENIKINIRNGLTAWENASHGTIKFIEVENPGWRFNGISFYLGNNQVLKQDNIAAYTQIKVNNWGFLQQVGIVFQDDYYFWSTEKSNHKILDDRNTITHEIGHAIGAEHLHLHPSILDKIARTPDGVYCSVMPYINKISNSFNQCNHHCTTSFAGLPGPLDEHFCSAVYNDDFVPQQVNYHLVQNTMNAFYEGLVFSSAKGFCNSAFTHMMKPSSARLLSPVQAHFLTDVLFVSGMIYYRFPQSYLNSFLVNALIQYLPNQIFSYLPTPIAAIIKNQLHKMVFSLGCAAYEGFNFYPFLQTFAAGLAGSVMGSTFGDTAGKIIAGQASKVWKWISDTPEDIPSTRPPSRSHYSFFKATIEDASQNNNTSIKCHKNKMRLQP